MSIERPAQELPAANAALPRDPAALAVALTDTTRRLHAAVVRREPAAPVPEDVTYLALYHQRMLRLMSAHRGLGDAALRRLPRDVLGDPATFVGGRDRPWADAGGAPPADDAGMKGVLAFVALVIAVNVAVRFVPLPDVDVDIPSPPDWLHWALRVKNALIAAFIALAVIGALRQTRRR